MVPIGGSQSFFMHMAYLGTSRLIQLRGFIMSMTVGCCKPSEGGKPVPAKQSMLYEAMMMSLNRLADDRLDQTTRV